MITPLRFSLTNNAPGSRTAIIMVLVNVLLLKASTAVSRASNTTVISVVIATATPKEITAPKPSAAVNVPNCKWVANSGGVIAVVTKLTAPTAPITSTVANA